MPPTSIISNIKIPAATSDKGFKFVYVRRHEVCRPSNDRDKCCRVLAVSDYQVESEFSESTKFLILLIRPVRRKVWRLDHGYFVT